MLEREFDVVLPVQFFRAGPCAAMQPEHRLMLAVLEDAVGQVTRFPVTRETQATWAWFASDDVTWPYSFANLCDALGLDAAAVRAALGRRTVRAAA